MKIQRVISATFFLFLTGVLLAQNPIIRDQFTADPSARVYGDKVYLYPSHDILGKEGQGRPGWFCMEDYHVFSSDNLTDWTDHGIILSQDKTPWTNPTGYSLWAPDCIFKNGKYYFYFPSSAKDTSYGRGFSIGVAIADNPSGPFIPEQAPIKKVRGIDPCPFIDKDGQAYLYWSGGRIFGAKLEPNMLALASETQVMKDLPTKGLIEGPYMFERNGIYYMTYPHVQNKIERLEYATGDNPLGPFTYAGVIMDESPMNCWTNHHSFIEFKGQWYLFYHQNALSPKFDKNRAVCIDSMFFNADGTIRKVIPTLRGVGITKASEKIQTDRYSMKSEKGCEVSFLDTLNTFAGWKTLLSAGGWVQYNTVDFGQKKPKTMLALTSSETGGTLEFRLDSADGLLLAVVEIPAGKAWIPVSAKLSKSGVGVHNLLVIHKEGGPVEVDWVSFK
ncbi:MAG: family 43 glycosylhydrolase [Bacteroidales bacterium]